MHYTHCEFLSATHLQRNWKECFFPPPTTHPVPSSISESPTYPSRIPFHVNIKTLKFIISHLIQKC